MFKTLFFLFGIVFFFNIFTIVYAGGGSIQPINFAHAQQIAGKSFNPEVAIKDPSTGYQTYLSGQEYTIKATGGLPGAFCETTQKISDQQGRIKASCKADSYGKFGFDVIHANGENHAHFDIYFTENSSGFSTEGSQGTYTVSIDQTSFTIAPNTSFILSAQLKKNGEVTTDYSDLQYFYWQVLEGSLTSPQNAQTTKNSSQFMSGSSDKTVVRVIAIMNDGSQVESGAITITFTGLTKTNPVKQTPATSPVPTATNESVIAPIQVTSSNSMLLMAGSQLPTSLEASISALTEQNTRLTSEVEELKQENEYQEQQLTILQSIVKKLQNMLSSVFNF